MNISQRWLRWSLCAPLLIMLAACSLPQPPAPATPRATAVTILEITLAPTQDIEATATAYARMLIASPTPAGLYVVQPGDTLGALASEFGTTVEELMAANGLTDPNALQIGQSLIIPSLASGAFVAPTLPAAYISPTPLETATPQPTLTVTPRPRRTPTPTPPPAEPTAVPVEPTAPPLPEGPTAVPVEPTAPPPPAEPTAPPQPEGPTPVPTLSTP